MTKKIILINETDDESRVAIAEDSVLQEMLIEHRTIEQTKNNIYKGTVVQIQSSLQAAFVDFGNKKHGFLPSSEINSSMYQRKGLHNSSPIQQKLKKGQPILVQVTREAVDQKGAALTTNISLPGRFMVLMPNSNKGGISKKIDDSEERDRLKSFTAAIDAEKHAVIIRTAGVGRDLVELKKDYTTLKKTWEEIHRSFKETKKPGIILEEADVVTRTLRDYYAEDIEEIWVDNPETFQKSLNFLKQVAPRRQKDLKLFISDRSLFSTYKIERQVEQLTSREVKLASGGSIVIDQTEALVAIDVNSGKSNQEGDIDATALRTNLEAANEIARHLRLRNLGGLIVIDFIDMEHDQARKKVEEELQNAMSRDKAQRKYNPISQFGLLEMSRQRMTVRISSTVESNCPVCNGKGRIPSLLASTNLILRSIREAAAKGNLVQIEGVLPLELANHLLNERRQSITDLELEFGIDIILRGEPQMVVFDESHLKTIFDKTPQDSKEDSAPEKEFPKEDDRKKKSQQKDKGVNKKSEAVDKKKRPPEKRDDSRSKKAPHTETVPEELKQTATEQQPAPVSADAEPKADNERPADVKKPDAVRPIPPKAAKKPAHSTDGSIYPSCLFLDIQEPDAEVLGEMTIAFENRLKGKPDNQAPHPIDQKYLWKNRDNGSKKESDSTTSKLPQAEALAIPEDSQTDVA
ncbi:MAG: Rne/Rng family ribonuclease, partial [Deltaproteobacteria bacterium]|nr:Rne/Rng family ribonuclease [Deltaproteobacteria bacterium]